MIDLKTFASEHCSWCGIGVPPHERIALGAPLEIGPGVNPLCGCAVEVDVDGYVLTGVMFEAESREKSEGFDLSMTACSDKCADEAMLHAGKAGVTVRPLSEACVQLKVGRA